MVALQVARRVSTLMFVLCMFVRCARPQESTCINDVFNEENYLNEGLVICDKYTDSRFDRCPNGTVKGLSYRDDGYMVNYGSNLTAFSKSSTFDVFALKICYKEVSSVTFGDLNRATPCGTSEMTPFIDNSFKFSCDNLPNLINIGLTIIVFRAVDDSQCLPILVVIDTTGLAS